MCLRYVQVLACHKSVCRLSVCNVHAPETLGVEAFGNKTYSTVYTLAIFLTSAKIYGDRPGEFDFGV